MDRLKYTNIMTNHTIYDSGLEEWEDIVDIYSDSFKKHVILRVDGMTALSDIFSMKTITELRDVIVTIAKDLFADNDLSEVLLHLIDIDVVFRNGINQIYNECPPDKPFGEYIPIALANRIIGYKESLRQQFTGTSNFIICESDGYIYFSIPDELGYKINIPNIEVISNAKNWDYNV